MYNIIQYIQGMSKPVYFLINKWENSRCARILKFKYILQRTFFYFNNMMRHMQYIQFGVLIKCAQLKLIYFASDQMERFLLHLPLKEQIHVLNFGW